MCFGGCARHDAQLRILKAIIIVEDFTKDEFTEVNISRQPGSVSNSLPNILSAWRSSASLALAQLF